MADVTEHLDIAKWVSLNAHPRNKSSYSAYLADVIQLVWVIGQCPKNTSTLKASLKKRIPLSFIQSFKVNDIQYLQ